MKRRRISIIGLAAGMLTVVVALTGCAQVGAVHGDLVYSGSVSGAEIASVEYSFVEPLNGAMGLADMPGSNSWTKTMDGGSGPHLTVSPMAKGIATCSLAEQASKEVLVTQTGKPGEPVSCSLDRRK